MVFGCCKKTTILETKERIVVQNGSTTPQYGIENLTYKGVQYDSNEALEKVKSQESSEPNKADNLPEEAILNNNTSSTDDANTPQDTSSNQDNPAVEKRVKKSSKAGVTWASPVNNKSDNEDNDSIEQNLSEKFIEDSKPVQFSVPTIVVENVDSPTVAKVFFQGSNGLSKNEIDHNVSKNNFEISQENATENENVSHQIDLLFEPIHIQETASLDLEFSEDDSCSEDKTRMIHSESHQSLDMDDAEYRRTAQHLKNMRDHIQKLGSLIDRFDGFFMQHLHDEIEANLRCCSQNVADVECLSFENLIQLKQTIQDKIQKYITILDEKTESAVPQTEDIKLNELEEKVKVLQEEINDFNENSVKSKRDEVLDTEKCYNNGVKRNESIKIEKTKDNLLQTI